MWASFTSVADDSVGTGEQQNKAEIYLLTVDEIAEAKCASITSVQCATLHCGLVLTCLSQWFSSFLNSQLVFRLTFCLLEILQFPQ